MNDASEQRRSFFRMLSDRRKSIRRTALWVVGALIVFTLAGFFGAPPLIKWQAQKALAATLGRQVSIEHVAFNPFMLSLTVEGLHIAEADGKSDFVRVQRAYANAQLSSIFRGIVLERIQIERPEVNLVRLTNERYNFSDIVDRIEAQPKSADDSSPTHFSLNNIELTEGRVTFDDRAEGAKHLVEHINIGVPFLSNLPTQVTTFVQPKLEAVVNGSQLQLYGRARPFADHREAEMKIDVAPFDVARYLSYAPSLPVRIQQGKLGLNINALWRQDTASGAQSLQLSGNVTAHDANVADRKGAPLVAFQRLSVDIQRLAPLVQPLQAQIGRVTLDAPQLDVVRHADGSINLVSVGESPAAVKPSAKGPATNSAPAAKPTARPLVTVAELAIGGGTVRWKDESVPKGFAATLNDFRATLEGFDLSGKTPAKLTAQAKSDAGETITLDSTFDATGKTDGKVAVAGVGIARYRPYFAEAVGDVGIDGKAEVSTAFSYMPDGKDAGFATRDGKLTLTGASMVAPRTPRPTLKLAELTVDGFAIAPERRELSVDKVTSRGAQWEVTRGHEGDFDIVTMWPIAKSGAGAKPQTQASEQPWKVRVGGTELNDWALRFNSRYGTTPVVTRIDRIVLKSGEYSTAGKAPMDLDLRARIDGSGAINVRGKLQPEPLRGRLSLNLSGISLLTTQPYVDREYSVLITQGKASAKGTLDFDLSREGEPQVAYDGNIGVSDFNSLDRINNTDFVRWKSFAVNGLKTKLAPLTVQAADVHLDSAYSRLILSADGKFNLREVAQPLDAQRGAPTAQETPADNAAKTEPEKPAQTAGTGSATVSPPPAQPLNVRVDKFTIIDSNINYSDRLVRPNFDANLTEVNGTLTGLSSDQSSAAQLDLHAAVDHAAPVAVSGGLNPFRQDRYLDIKADVSNVDLTGASTYAIKYVGYGIDKGKLSMKLAYRIEDRKLTAQNQVYLDQLTFGQHVDSPTATKLPVLLAVALLKDRNGVIDVSLPISGTLDDPEFSIGGLVVRVIVNLLTKAVTAPFALLGSMFGGNGEELAYVEFDPGLSKLAPAAQDKLKNLSKALIDRPGLRLQIAGRADAAADTDALKQEVLASRMRAVKARELVRRGHSVGAVDDLQITPEESPKLLASVYDAEKFDKPKNMIGLTKSLPPADMEKLILEHIKVGDEELRALGNQRAQTVKAWLIDEGKVPADRIFMLAVQLGADDKNKTARASRVDFSLQ